MNRWGFLGFALLGATLPAFAGITYVCDGSISNPANSAPANLCDMLNGPQVAGVYSSIFSNVSASIYIQFQGPGLGESSTALNTAAYSDYLTALTGHEGDVNDITAVNSLNNNATSAYGSDNVLITSALGNALGLSDTAGLALDGGADGTSCNTLGVGACLYNGIITIGAPSPGQQYYYPLSPGDSTGTGWDFFFLVEHETDEILGTISCLGTETAGTPWNACDQSLTGTDLSPADLFRYSAPQTLSFLNTANGTPAYFSIDGGNTDIAEYNNSPNGSDYGDWVINVTNPYRVQDGEAPQSANLDISTDDGSEIAVLDAVGFNLKTIPEPGTMGLLGASLAILVLARARAAHRR